MGKKNIKPQQQQPIIRHTTAKSVKVQGLSEENLTQNQSDASGAIPLTGTPGLTPCVCSFDGDDAE